MASNGPLAPSQLELLVVWVVTEAHGWARQPYGRFDLSRRPEQQRHPTFALTTRGGTVWPKAQMHKL